MNLSAKKPLSKSIANGKTSSMIDKDIKIQNFSQNKSITTEERSPVNDRTQVIKTYILTIIIW